jgi:hypothetical protein
MYISLIIVSNQALKRVWINIYDFLDEISGGQTAPRFRNQQALATYTQKEGKIFPRHWAKEGGPLRALLAHIN